jgi:ParB-like nuclease domain
MKNTTIEAHLTITIIHDDKEAIGASPSPSKLSNEVASQDIYEILTASFKKKSIKWVKQVVWSGPIEVPLSSIDFSNQAKWVASQDKSSGLKKVEADAKKMDEQGPTKPVILIKMSRDETKLQVLDGRHRLLAAKKSNIPILAYIGDVSSLDGKTSWLQMKPSL